jgi:hypothetical protein
MLRTLIQDFGLKLCDIHKVIPNLTTLDLPDRVFLGDLRPIKESVLANIVLTLPVLKRLGIKILPVGTNDDSFGELYNGVGISISFFNGDGHVILHEIAHFIVAPKERKRVPNFGLGLDGTVGTEEYPLLVSPLEAYEEEMKAVALEPKLKRAIIPYANI